MKFKLPSPVIKVLYTLEAGGFEAFVVGGAVRDLLTETAVTDWDFTTDATPEQIMKMFPHSYYNNQFGTVGIPMKQNNDQLIFEVTTHRKESEYTNVRHPDKIEWSKDLNEDLARRDFTINAIAYDGETLFDPYDGQKDIDAKLFEVANELGHKKFNKKKNEWVLSYAVTIENYIRPIYVEKMKKLYEHRA